MANSLRRNSSLPLLAAALLTCGSCTYSPDPQAASPPARATAPAAAQPRLTLACTGRIESRSEVIEVAAAADGVIKSLSVHEGEKVKRGQKLAALDCSELDASLAMASAEAQRARQNRVRLLRGSRPEERAIAAQKTVAARSVRQRAAQQLSRMRSLSEKDNVPRSALEDAQRDFELAEARLQEAVRNEEMMAAGPLPEEIARVDAEVAAAEARYNVIQQRLGKCAVTSPIDGTVLQILLHPGEAFSTIMPKPIVSVADLSVLRVRAEVDERDVMKVRVGQKALVFPESQQDRKFAGVVQRVSRIMGRRKYGSNDPAEKADRDVLESIVELTPPTPNLPLGLRVLVQFLQ